MSDRYRQVPPFWASTIRRFSANTSEMSNMAVVTAARNFEDLLQCAIPVFDGLLPDTQNKIVIDLLFVMAHWHGLAKLRMHSDLTLQILNQQTIQLGEHLRQFKAKVCSIYNTQELNRELDARSRRQAKEAVKWAVNGSQQGATADTLRPAPHQQRRKKSFNLQTYKLHTLGDYVACIRDFGTTDSYSTEPVSPDFFLPTLQLSYY
ncbi:hypothetical protein C8R48DRAFT_618674 [Suillus tomentosus]|nr:hypothetical protein C8R48DRAFT_618674 [Suillus tomentosus]